MAQDKSIDELERDVEQARARVAADLALLRSPETYEAAKNGVMEAALGYRDQKVDGVVGTLRAKAAANPLAVAAIGAGVAWRLYKHPPIASVLIGLGVTALMRTDPNDDSMHPRRLMEAASQRASEMKERAAAQIADLKEAATGVIEEKTRQFTAAAERTYERAAERVSSMGSSGASHGEAAHASTSFARTGDPEALGASATRMRAPTADMPIARGSDGALWEAEDSYASGRAERRDAYLLGVAALAVGAAVGLSRMRQGEEFEDDGDFHRDHEFEQREGERTTWRRL